MRGGPDVVMFWCVVGFCLVVAAWFIAAEQERLGLWPW